MKYTQTDFALWYLKKHNNFSPAKMNAEVVRNIHKDFLEWRWETGYLDTISIAPDSVRRYLQKEHQKGNKKVGLAKDKKGYTTFFWTDSERGAMQRFFG